MILGIYPFGAWANTPACPCALSVSGSTIRLGQDRLGCALELGAVRVFEVPRVEQRGKANHQVNPGGAGGKCLEGSGDGGS